MVRVGLRVRVNVRLGSALEDWLFYLGTEKQHSNIVIYIPSQIVRDGITDTSNSSMAVSNSGALL